MSSLYEIFRNSCTGVSTDSRSLKGGEMFFALKGDNFDGNKYATAALENGARCVIADDKALEGTDKRIIVVEDSLIALQNLASEHRECLGLRIIGLTGTNGKTTTKEFMRAALSTRFERVGATEGNLNNHIGVPLTLLSFNEETEIGIVEMGANHPGEIARLCEIAKPNIGLITNVGKAHLEGFGSAEAIRTAKGELYDYLLNNNGIAIFNGDNAVLKSMIEERDGLRSIEYRAESGIGFELKMFGAYNTRNAAAAMAVALHCGCEVEMIRCALNNYVPKNNRGQIIERTVNGNRLIIDCYNANPSSMDVAITEFLSTNHQNMSKVMILGAMKELGKYSQEEHAKVVELSKTSNLTIFIGEEFKGLCDAENLFNTVEEAREYILSLKLIGVEILLKGSRSNKLEQLIEVL